MNNEGISSMKKVFAAVALSAVISVTGGRTQTTNPVSNTIITLQGKLSPSGRKVTEADLGDYSFWPLQVMVEQIVDGVTTNLVKTIGYVENRSVLLTCGSQVNLTPMAKTSHKFMEAYFGTSGSATNAVLLFSGTSTATVQNPTNQDARTIITFTGTVSGIWCDGASTVQGTFKSITPTAWEKKYGPKPVK